ncbi:MAG: hypothetical protein H6735_12155 [Alphaproteobacteria bacterium]|nr:hypothetical protein [Alphaproteobacteria bacterium]
MIAMWVALAGCGSRADFATFTETGFGPRVTGGTMSADDCLVVYEGPVLVTHSRITCADDDMTLWFQTEGWTSGGQVFVQDTSGGSPQWAEEHALESVGHDVCGAWDELEVDIHAGVRTDQYIPDVTSAFACSDPGAGRLTYAVAVQDIEGDLADCVVFGHDPQALLAGGDRALDPTFDTSRCVVAELTR